MSADFETKLVYDSRLNDISDKITFSVEKGAADNTYQEFRANSETPTSINFTVNPPSEANVIDRHMLIQSTVSFSIFVGTAAVGAQLPPGTSAWEYSLRESMQSFPLARLMNTLTVSINNVSTSIAMNQVFPALLRMLDQEFMQKYNGMCPTYLDNYGNLSDAVGRQNNPMSGYGGASFNQFLLPRGCHPVEVQGFQIIRNGGVDNSPISTDFGDYWQINVVVKLTEPLFISPFIFGDPKYNNSGFLGINNFQVLCNIDSTMSRFWSTGLAVNNGGVADTSYTLQLTQFSDSKLLLNFLTSPIPLALPPKVTLPYSSYIAYVSNRNNPIAAKVERTAASTASLTINSIQFEVIPDKLIIFVRRALADQTVRSSDAFLEIRSLSCTFANRAGLLSNANQEQLWELTKKNGCNLDYYSFKGLSGRYQGAAPYVGEYATCGSVLVINPSMDFGIQSPYLSNGSIGQYNLQINNLLVANNFDEEVSPEVVVVAVRSGIIVTSAGQSTLTTNMLNSQIVTDTIQNDKNPMGSDVQQRLVGGAGGASEMPSDMMGNGTTGGARSGAGRSGGAKSAGKYSKLASLAM